MKRNVLRSLALVTLFALAVTARADEGLWPLPLNGKIYKTLRNKGLKISEKDIYSKEGDGLCHAVISFNGSCSGAIVSPDGLLLTNYHCCSEKILQQLPPLRNDTDIFCARTRQDEIPVRGLFIRKLVYIKDVTDSIALPNGKTADQNAREFLSRKKTEGPEYEYMVRALYEGNNYNLYAYERFSDIRIVAIPSSFWGSPKGNSDNWQWPRYSADFALFRVYAGPDNKPAEYSPENKPYRPSKYIPVTPDGYSENDLALVLGYPGSGTSFEISNDISLIQRSSPLRSTLFSTWIAMLNDVAKTGNTSEQVPQQIKGLSNRLEMWSVMLHELETHQPGTQLRLKEQSLLDKIKNDTIKRNLARLQKELRDTYDQMGVYSEAYDLYRDGLRNIMLLNIGRDIYSSLNKEGDIKPDELPEITSKIARLYTDYRPAVDEKYFVDVMSLYGEKVDGEFMIESFKKHSPDIGEWARSLYSESLLNYPDSVTRIIRESPARLVSDPAILLKSEIEEFYNQKIWPDLVSSSGKINALKKEYVKNIISCFPDSAFWSDGNGTLRLSYGNIIGYDDLNFQTTLSDLSFDEPELYSRFGALVSDMNSGSSTTTDKRLPLCFITTAHTSSGSSGSPVINSKGELIGLNFDRNQVGTMGDYYYDIARFRNIAVDIRYILFILKKSGRAESVLHELLPNVTYP